MLKINLLESTNLAFEMIVEGTSNSVDKAWIVLETDEGFDIRVPAKYENNRISCSAPVSENIMRNGPAMLHLEVVVDGRYFRPVSEEVQIGASKQDVRILSKSSATRIQEKITPAEKPAKLTKAETFEESLSTLDKLKEKYTSPVEEFQFGKRFEEAFAQSKAEHDKKMREARAIAGALLADVKPGKVTEDKASLDRLKILLGKK